MPTANDIQNVTLFALEAYEAVMKLLGEIARERGMTTTELINDTKLRLDNLEKRLQAETDNQ